MRLWLYLWMRRLHREHNARARARMNPAPPEKVVYRPGEMPRDDDGKFTRG